MKTQNKATAENSGRKKSDAEQNKHLVRRAVEEIWNNGKYETLKEFIADDFTIHMSNPNEKIHGLNGVTEYYTQLRKAFPDIHFTIDSQVAENDRVVTQWTAQGTHIGNFRGIAPTKRKFKITAIDIDRIVDGKVVECWPSIDELALLQQLGVSPMPDNDLHNHSRNE
jgi:steroid delta-isomerase-like uncharacterized protein